MIDQLRASHQYLPKDFVLCDSGLFCALVGWGSEDGRLLATPRYIIQDSASAEGCVQLPKDKSQRCDRSMSIGDESVCKIPPKEVASVVDRLVPHWIVECPRRGIPLIAIPEDEVATHIRPEVDWKRAGNHCEVGQPSVATPEVYEALGHLIDCIRNLTDLGENLGVTGSVLIGHANQQSDLDVTVYGAENFRTMQSLVRGPLAKQADFSELDIRHWREAFERRNCALSWDDYLWHERRKANKFLWKGRRVDLSCIADPPKQWNARCKKLGPAELEATVTDDRHSACYGGVYGIEHPEIVEIVNYSPTYCCQAAAGERIQAAGCIEVAPDGHQRLVVGTGPLAQGEFLRVIR